MYTAYVNMSLYIYMLIYVYISYLFLNYSGMIYFSKEPHSNLSPTSSLKVKWAVPAFISNCITLLHFGWYLFPVLLRVEGWIDWVAGYRQVHCVSKNDTDSACNNSDVHQTILIIFDGSVAERVSYQIIIYFSTSHD